MDNETATDITTVPVEKSAQDITATIEERLYGTAQGEPIDTTEEEAPEDDQGLPKGETPDTEEDEGSDLEEGGEVDDEDEDKSLAQYLGVDEDRIVADDDGNLTLTTIIDGESKSVDLGELVKSYQIQGHVNNKSIALETERKEFEEARNEVSTNLKTKIDGVIALSKVLENQLVEDYNSIDWDTLRINNPAEWTALRQEFADKARGVKESQEQTLAAGRSLMEDQQAEQFKKFQEHSEIELGKMIQDDPKWADPAVREADSASLRSFLSETYGFSDGDLNTINDHRLVRVLKDAKLYREGSKAATVKKEKRVPKFRKPGASKKQTAALSKARSVKAKRAQVKASGGKTEDIANLILDRM